MKKNIMRPIVCLLAATVFLMPLMGNTALADEKTVEYHFNSYNPFIAWETNPQYMVDGNEVTCAETTIDGDVELCDDNTLSFAPTGTITKVELQVTAKYDYRLNQRDTILQPVFGGSSDGEEHPYETTWRLQDSPWFDITDDENGPGAESWDWSDVEDLDCKVEAENNPSGGEFTLFVSMVRIRVTYE